MPGKPPRPQQGPGSSGAAGLRRAAMHRGRSLARRLAVQALYQLQMNPRPWAEVQRQYAADPESDRADLAYFEDLFAGIAPHIAVLDERLRAFSEIAPADLDPVEHAILWLGLHELAAHPELPYRIAIDEAVQLTKQFGATDGHKYVNAVLDRAARESRPQEYGQPAA
jgi:N utilization substance protein B